MRSTLRMTVNKFELVTWYGCLSSPSYGCMFLGNSSHVSGSCLAVWAGFYAIPLWNVWSEDGMPCCTRDSSIEKNNRIRGERKKQIRPSLRFSLCLFPTKFIPPLLFRDGKSFSIWYPNGFPFFHSPPDRLFYNFGASRSGDQRILFSFSADFEAPKGRSGCYFSLCNLTPGVMYLMCVRVLFSCSNFNWAAGKKKKNGE